MNVLLWIFDVVLVLALLGLAVRTLTAKDLFQSVTVFIAFGLLLALVWMRLDAPDIALAEAAIGAGLIGVLLLDAMRVGGSAEIRQPEDEIRNPKDDIEGGRDET